MSCSEYMLGLLGLSDWHLGPSASAYGGRSGEKRKQGMSEEFCLQDPKSTTNVNLNWFPRRDSNFWLDAVQLELNFRLTDFVGSLISRDQEKTFRPRSKLRQTKHRYGHLKTLTSRDYYDLLCWKIQLIQSSSRLGHQPPFFYVFFLFAKVFLRARLWKKPLACVESLRAQRERPVFSRWNMPGK